MANQIAKIAVENTSYSFDDAFDYAIPPQLQTKIQPGIRVLVPFGRSNQKRQGIVFALREPSSSKKLKSIISVLDKEPILTNEMLRLAVFLKERTFCTLFEAAKAMFPSGIGLRFVLSYLSNPEISLQNAEKDLPLLEFNIFSFLEQSGKFQKKDSILKQFSLSADSSVLEDMQKKGYLVRNVDTQKKTMDATIKMAKLSSLYLESTQQIKLTPKQKEVVQFLEQVETASVKEICYYTGVTTAVIMTLSKRGYIELFQNEIYRRPESSNYVKVPDKITLTEEQETAFKGLQEKMHADTSATALLFGVTGSGKTQVFLKLIDEAVQKHKNVIMMVPEISLTPQMLSIFYHRYGDKVAVFHSALSMGERVDEWKRVQRGEAQIALGTRSAVFAPFHDIGLIIMDEEQEHTYKSEMTPKYDTHEVARFRADYHKALLLLASATPSIETYSRAIQGQYSLYTLQNRYGKAELPNVIAVDEFSPEKQIGDTLLSALEENINQGHQSVLLLNRRGYNTFASCTKCKSVLTCPNCSISLTYHQRNNRLMCHYCGYSQPFTTDCPVCSSKDSIVYSGIGTQRLEDELQELLPKAKVLRLDTDTTTSKFAFENALQKFTNQEYDIMIGTQMVAKGLDFPNVTLVGVLSVDQMLYNDDYKSAERTFDLLTQVVGRAGRGKEKGKAIIQTAFPEHEVIELATRQDFPSFYNLDMQIRKSMIYPPYCDICIVGFIGKDEIQTKSAAKFFLEKLKETHKAKYSSLNLIVLGPMTPKIPKISGKYRYRIIIKCKANKTFCSFLSEEIKKFLNDKNFKKIAIVPELNPDSIF